MGNYVDGNCFKGQNREDEVKGILTSPKLKNYQSKVKPLRSGMTLYDHVIELCG